MSALLSVSSLLLVTLADGSSYTKGVGTTNATHSLSLSSVVYVPKFPFNLLSVSRLIKSLNYSLAFFPDYCVPKVCDAEDD